MVRFICPVQFLTIESSFIDIFLTSIHFGINVIVNSFHRNSNLAHFLWLIQPLTTELDFIESYIY